MINVRKPRRKRNSYRGEPCDVFMCSPNFSTWAEYRLGRVGSLLAEHGIKLDGTVERCHQRDILRDIKNSGCKIVLNEVWRVSHRELRGMADALPDVTFISVNHGSPSVGSDKSHDSMVANHYAFSKLSQELPNCWYGTVMDESYYPTLPGGKVVSLPNVFKLPDNLADLDRLDDSIPCLSDGVLRVGIIGRHVGLKNWPAQVAAIGELAKVIPVNAVLSGYDLNSMFENYSDWLTQCGVPSVHVPWGKWDNYMAAMYSGIDVLFHASTSESFGSIPAEAMLMGIPVVGSPAIHWMPKAWQADYQSPHDMARIALEHAENYRERSNEAKVIAKLLAAKNEAKFIANLKRFL